MTIFVIDLHDVDTANQNFTAYVVMRAIWHDERLAHNDATGKVVHPLTDIWHPLLQWVNQERASKTFPETVEVSSEGKVTYLQRVWGQFTQPLRLRDFPFDEQEFNITLRAAEHTPDEVRLVQDSEFPSGLADNLSLAEWKVISSETMTGSTSHFVKSNP